MIEITFEDVCAAYGEHVIFSHLSKRVIGGHITAVTGENGSGKSTLLRLAGHLLHAQVGHVLVRVDGKEIRQAELRSRIAMVTPEMKLYDQLTARENMDFLLGLRGIALTDAMYTDCICHVGLSDEELEGKYIDAFSTGMRQRLKLAILFLSGADIWLLDEPGANLDAAGREMLLKASRQAADMGRIVLIATNDNEEGAAADDTIRL